MKRFLLSALTLLLIGCGPSDQEKLETAIITCNIMGESRNMDAAMRIREINSARESIGEDAYLGTDSGIVEAIQYDLCPELVLNDPEYSAKLLDRQWSRLEAIEEREEAERIAREEAERIAREEAERIAREELEAFPYDENDLEVLVDRYEIALGETLTYTIRLFEQRQGMQLDLTPLTENFDVQGTRTSSQIRSNNGSVESWTDYIVTLSPLREGELVIPSLIVGGARTESITVTVDRLTRAGRYQNSQQEFTDSILSVFEEYPPSFSFDSSTFTDFLRFSNGSFRDRAMFKYKCINAKGLMGSITVEFEGNLGTAKGDLDGTCRRRGNPVLFNDNAELIDLFIYDNMDDFIQRIEKITIEWDGEINLSQYRANFSTMVERRDTRAKIDSANFAGVDPDLSRLPHTWVIYEKN